MITIDWLTMTTPAFVVAFQGDMMTVPVELMITSYFVFIMKICEDDKNVQM